MKRLEINKNASRNERPYFVNNDNNMSDYKIEQPTFYTYYENLTNVLGDQKLTKALVVDNYFDTDYLLKIKKEAIKL